MLSDPTTIPLFHQLGSSEHPDDPYGPLIKCLMMEEEYAVLGSLRVLAPLIAYAIITSNEDEADNSTDPKPFPQNLVATLLASLQGLLNGTRQPLWEVAAQVLGAVLGSKQFRSAVWKEEHCISGSAIHILFRLRADQVV